MVRRSKLGFEGHSFECLSVLPNNYHYFMGAPAFS
ncbi:hypothetical protein FOXYSP1_09232 [Fusarium oxysporum f. sp. phaseoli]